jgi:general secretion pathway protein A
MYKHFFGLRENPFNVNPDPRYLFLTPQTRLALHELKSGIRARKGLILLTGEVGTGKTTLINRLLDQLAEQQTPTAFIFNSHLETSHLFDFILADFGVPSDPGSSTNALMRLNQWLLERYRAGQTPVLVVDEAQGLPTHVLEEIRMLLNLETPRDKLLQIVLVGQPELEERIKRPELRQIKQRVALRCKTAPLDLNQTHAYIQSRLEIAGANGKPIFVPKAMDAVHFYSRGIPRIMNLLCENALTSAYENQVQPVPAQIVAEIAYKFQFDDAKLVVPPWDDRNELDLQWIAPQSGTVDLAAALPAMFDAPCREHADAPANLASPSLVAADPVPSSVAEPGTPVLHCENGTVLHPEAGSHGATELQVTTAPASQQLPMGPSQASELSAFFHEVGVQFFSGSATTAFSVGPSTFPHMASESTTDDSLPESKHSPVSSPRMPTRSQTESDATTARAPQSVPIGGVSLGIVLSRLSRWKERQMVTVILPARALGTTIVVERLKRSRQRVGPLYRQCLVLTDQCLHFVGSLDRTPIAASVYRWLRQPWNPSPRRVPELRLPELFRRSSHKKV